MITQDDSGERALAAALEMVAEGREEVGRYVAAIARGAAGGDEGAAAVRGARLACLALFGDRPINRGALLRALALIDGAIDRLDREGGAGLSLH
jgi:hypothetical protein